MLPEVKIRRAQPKDAESILQVRLAAICGKAASYYTAEQLEGWVQESPVNPASIDKQKQFLSDEGTCTYVAEYKGAVIGFSAIVPARNELRRIFVAPGEWRGVGGQLLEWAEAETRKLGLTYLACESSLNAEKFYAKHGYEIIERTMYHMQCGIDAPSVKMKKHLSRMP